MEGYEGELALVMRMVRSEMARTTSSRREGSRKKKEGNGRRGENANKKRRRDETLLQVVTCHRRTGSGYANKVLACQDCAAPQCSWGGDASFEPDLPAKVSLQTAVAAAGDCNLTGAQTPGAGCSAAGVRPRKGERRRAVKKG